VRLLTYASRTNLFSSMIEYDVIRPQRLEKLEKKVLARGWRRNRWIIGPADVFTTVISFASPINLPDQYLLPGRGHTLGERYLQDPKDPRALFPMRPEWLINATVYNETPEANAFLFDEKTFNRYRSDWMNYRVSNAVAASAAFPVLFAPVSWRDWSSKAPSWLFLLDGGVSDNLGLNGVKLAMGRSNAPRASVVILVDAFTREGRVVRRKSDRPSVVEVSARALDRYMFVTRAQARASPSSISRLIRRMPRYRRCPRTCGACSPKPIGSRRVCGFHGKNRIRFSRPRASWWDANATRSCERSARGRPPAPPETAPDPWSSTAPGRFPRAAFHRLMTARGGLRRGARAVAPQT
jgi:hypothetical protein